MDVKVLGTGCDKCKQLHAEAEKAIADSGVRASLAKVEVLEDILAYGVMTTPALVIDGQVKASGRVPASTEIAAWLSSPAEAPSTSTEPCCEPGASCCCGGEPAPTKAGGARNTLALILIVAAVAVGLYAVFAPSAPRADTAAPPAATQPASGR